MLGWVKRRDCPSRLPQELAGTAQEPQPLRRRIVAAARRLQGSLGIVVATWGEGFAWEWEVLPLSPPTRSDRESSTQVGRKRPRPFQEDSLRKGKSGTLT